jgi:hypothetical protein
MNYIYFIDDYWANKIKNYFRIILTHLLESHIIGSQIKIEFRRGKKLHRMSDVARWHIGCVLKMNMCKRGHVQPWHDSKHAWCVLGWHCLPTDQGDAITIYWHSQYYCYYTVPFGLPMNNKWVDDEQQFAVGFKKEKSTLKTWRPSANSHYFVALNST